MVTINPAPSLERLTSLRLTEKETREEIIKEIKRLGIEKTFKYLGARSFSNFLESRLGYNSADSRALLVAMGLVVTREQMKDDDPAKQQTIDSLIAWRIKTARALNISAFLVLTNRTLLSIARAQPRSEKELRAIDGMGEGKLKSFGQDILAHIAAHAIISRVQPDAEPPAEPELVPFPGLEVAQPGRLTEVAHIQS